MKITISNNKNLEQLKSKIKQTGYQNLHILSDFDGTLTCGVTNGVKAPAIISLLRDGNYLTKDYAEKAHALFNKYHPIETDVKVPVAKKKKAMQKWWELHYKLLIKSGLTKSDLKHIVESGHIKFRDGVPEFLDFLYKKNIPLVVFSAGGCGEAIKLFFKKIKKNYPNVFFVINRFNWNKQGRAISIKPPIIHSMNKDKTIIKKIPNIYSSIKNRKNVILIGDSIGDIKIIEGFNCANLLKIGFLNFNYNESIKEYTNNFDVVLDEEANFDFINSLIQELK